jgi:hypothetical protein
VLHKGACSTHPRVVKGLGVNDEHSTSDTTNTDWPAMVNEGVAPGAR